MALPAGRRRALQELGLRALIKRRFGEDVAQDAHALRFAAGAAVQSGTRVAVFADSAVALGSAIDLTNREGGDRLYFFAEDSTGVTARRAEQFRIATTVVSPDGDFDALAPTPPAVARPRPAALAPAAARLNAAGLDVEWEHDVLTGEWLGLEVARTPTGAVAALRTDGGVSLGADDGPAPKDDGPAPKDDGPALKDDRPTRKVDGPALEVGVGKHDREGNRLLYPEGAPDAVLDQAVALVRDLRRPAAAPHPANQLAPERWLRAVLARRPELAGLTAFHAAPPPEPRTDLRRRAVAPGWGPDDQGRNVVVACSVGVDPDVVPQAADACCQAPGWPGFPGAADCLVVVVPEGDDHPLTRRLLGLLRTPAELVVVPAEWRGLAG